jgi:L-iditol 2-dehydrogenase
MFTNKIANMVAPGKFELAEEIIDVVPDDKILVQHKVCGICQGTEIWFWKGTDCDTGQPVEYPVLLGHQNAAEVVCVGKNVQGIEIGDRFTGSGVVGFQLYSLADPERCIRIPEAVTNEQASQAIELGSIIKEVDHANIRVGDKVAIIGAGPMGNLLMQVVKLHCPETIIVTDLDQSRLDLAKKLGADHTINASKEDQVRKIQEITNGGADIVFEATTSVECLKIAIDALRTEGKLVVFGTHPQPINLRTAEFKQKSCVVIYAFPTSDEWLPYARKGVRLLDTGGIDVESLVTHRFILEQMNQAFTLFEKNTNDVMKIMIHT